MEPAFGERGWDGHLLALYREESQRRGQVRAWVRRGLEVGAKILHIEPSDESPGRSLSGLLRDEADAVEAMTSGQIRVIPASRQAYDPAWQARLTARALRQFPFVRWSGDAITAWGVMPPARHADVEWTTDRVCKSHPVSVMCHYPVSAAMGVLGPVSAAHSAGLRETQLRAAPLPGGGLAVSGELDRSNQDIVRAVLSTATSTTRPGPFVVDLSGLQFLDVGGVRALAAGTHLYRRKGGYVRLQVQARVDRLLRVLGLDREPGILTEAPR